MKKLNVDLVFQKDDIAIWISDIANNLYLRDTFWDLLNLNERKKANSNLRFLIQRGMVRMLAGEYLGIDPKDIIVKKNHMGKPYIEGIDCEISYSHSDHFFMFAITSESEIGVDIQISKRLKYDYPIMIFNEDEKQNYMMMDNQDMKKDLFWKIWTKKEAYSKAIGMGMTINYNELFFVKTSTPNIFAVKGADGNKGNILMETHKTAEYYYTFVVMK